MQAAKNTNANEDANANANADADDMQDPLDNCKAKRTNSFWQPTEGNNR